MKKLTTSIALLIAGLAMFQSASAIPPPDKIIICHSNSKLAILHWNMLNGHSNLRQYRLCTAPVSINTDWVHSCPNITQGAYYASCGWDIVKPLPARPVLPYLPAQPRK